MTVYILTAKVWWKFLYKLWERDESSIVYLLLRQFRCYTGWEQDLHIMDCIGGEISLHLLKYMF